MFDSDLRMFYKFICSPFEIPMHKMALTKYDKHSKKLNVKQKKTFKSHAPFRYNPLKHNVYYFRSRRMLHTLMVKGNASQLKEGNPNYLSVFCRVSLILDDVLSEDVLQKSKSYIDMNHLILLIQFYFINSPAASAKLFMKHHVIFDLLAHIDYRFVRETLTYLLTPGDQFLKLPPSVYASLVAYCQLIDLHRLLVVQLTMPDDDAIYADKKKTANDARVKKFIDSLNEKMDSLENIGRKPNMFESLFNNLILGKLLKFSITQPEEEVFGLPNIDRLPLITLSNISKRRASMLGLSSDLVRLNQKLFENEIMPEPSPAPVQNTVQKRNEKNGSPLLKRMNTFQMYGGTSGKGGVKGVLKKSLTKVFSALAFLKKPAIPASELSLDFLEIPGKIYPEKVETFNINVLENKRLFKENFEFNLKNERHITCILDCLYSILSSPLLQGENREMAKLLHQPVSDINLIKGVFCSSPELYMTLITSFVVRLEYKAINNLEMTSIFSAGKLICLLLKHL